MNTKKTGLIGGAFNPPTIGHYKLAQFIMNSQLVDEVWLMPCYSHNHNKKMVSPQHRLNMCNLISNKNIKTSDYEIKNQTNGKTFDLITKLQNDPNYNNHQFYIVIGLDNANSIHKWANYQELLEITQFIVISRKGYSLDPNVDWFFKSPHIFMNARNIPETSSTQARQSINNSNDIDINTIINEKVYNYIKSHNLYG